MTNSPQKVVLRIDDVGTWEPLLERLLSGLLSAGFPVSLQIVPGWLDPIAIEQLSMLHYTDSARLEFCQHGWTHTNRAPKSERRYEFGPTRTRAEQQADIRSGRERMCELFPGSWVGVFTPPHDRLNQDTLDILAEEGYSVVSGGPRTFEGYHVPESLEAFPWSIDAAARKDGERRLRDPKGMVKSIEEQSSRVIGVVLHPVEIRTEKVFCN